MSNLNYQIYQAIYNIRSKVLRVVPYAFLPPRRNLNNILEIGVTTYIDRYEGFFKPLYKSLLLIFPEVKVRIAVNGFYDNNEQSAYLQKIEKELCSFPRNNTTFVLHDQPVGLTRLWNEILSQSQCEHTLLLNDDLYIYPWFRTWIERSDWNSNSITLINGTWSNFILAKSTIRNAGWFDEGYEGIGFEDMDYTARLGILGLPIDNLRCPFINHRDHKPSRTSYDKKTETIWGPKYSSINEEYFFKKWKTCERNKGVYIKQLGQYVQATDFLPIVTSEHRLTFDGMVCFPERRI